ncbi:Neuron navigator 2 [Myotis davidii]|uniref:Neuron navigator 2 n=1 Tax=Myotis davidii TaxID=225400 RepID=L5MG45_MYODS|nr:Neuron navigator 2 [Myotis davidii]
MGAVLWEIKLAAIYTDWANHYLAKSGHKRLIKDLQQDVTDGVLLAQIIQVVANEKIEDINGCPKNRSQMIENIDACLNFLAAKGINIQGLSAEGLVLIDCDTNDTSVQEICHILDLEECHSEIRNGNLKAILGLFFSLSRYKQQQQQPQKQHLSSPLPPAVSQAAGAPFQCQAGTPQQQVPATPQALCQPHQPAPHQQSKAQAEMQSSASSKDSSQSKIIRFTLGQKKISRMCPSSPETQESFLPRPEVPLEPGQPSDCGGNQNLPTPRPPPAQDDLPNSSFLYLSPLLLVDISMKGVTFFLIAGVDDIIGFLFVA